MAVELDLMEYPSDALAQAAYVSSDAASGPFGRTATGTENAAGANNIRASKFTSGGAGSLVSITLYLKYSVANANIKCALYDAALNIVANGTTEQKGITAGQDGWVTFNFSTPPNISASTVYWLAMWNSVEVILHYTTLTGDIFTYQVRAYNGWPASLTPNYLTREMSIYATYSGVNLQCYSEDTIKEQGDYSLKGVAVITLSLNDTLTRTVDPTVDLSDIDTLYFAIRASRTGSNIKVDIKDSGGTWTDITPNIASANTFQGVEWDISGVANANKDAINRIRFTITNAGAANTFYLDNMREGWPVLSHSLKLGFVPSFVLGPYGLIHSLSLGFVPSHSSITYGLKTLKLGMVPAHTSVITAAALVKKLGFVPDYTSIAYGELTKKLGFVPSYVLGPLGLLHSLSLGFVPEHTSIITGLLTKKLGLVPGLTSIVTGLLTKKLGLVPSHISTVFGVLTKKLGLTRSYASIIYGLLTKKLGFVIVHISQVYKFIVELRFYDQNDNLVKIISSKAQNFPLVDPGLEFTLLRDGGCGAFKFTTSEDLGIEKGYRLDLYLYESLWYSGRLEKVPEPGLSTSRTYKYSGFGFLSELDWKLIEEEYTGVELSTIVTDILEKYYYSKSDILEE